MSISIRALTDKTVPLSGESKVLRSARQLATAEASIYDEAGKLYAHATTCMVFSPKPST